MVEKTVKRLAACVVAAVFFVNGTRMAEQKSSVHSLSPSCETEGGCGIISPTL